jgi:hypothetical protein
MEAALTDPALKAFYKFDDADLIANQRGLITPGQLRRIRRQRTAIKLAALGIGAALIIVDVAGVAWLWQQRQVGTSLISFLGGDWGLLIPLVIGLAAVGAGFSKDDPVILSQVAGPAEIVKVKTRYRRSVNYAYELRCGPEKFEASARLLDTISPGAPCVVYYFKDLANGEINRVLSVERVGGSPRPNGVSAIG